MWGPWIGPGCENPRNIVFEFCCRAVSVSRCVVVRTGLSVRPSWPFWDAAAEEREGGKEDHSASNLCRNTEIEALDELEHPLHNWVLTDMDSTGQARPDI